MRPRAASRAADPLLTGQVLTVFAITIAAAEVGVALAVDPAAVPGAADQRSGRRPRTGAASPTYSEDPGAGSAADPLTGRTGPPEPAGASGRSQDSGEDGAEGGDGARSAGGPAGAAAAVTGGDR